MRISHPNDNRRQSFCYLASSCSLSLDAFIEFFFFYAAFDTFHVVVHLVPRGSLHAAVFARRISSLLPPKLCFGAERDERPVIGTGAAPTRRKSSELALLSSLSPLQAYFLKGVPIFLFIFFIFLPSSAFVLLPHTVTVFSRTQAALWLRRAAA